MVVKSAGGTRNAQYTNQIKRTEEKSKEESKKLSSGKRVNSAADDAAALSISNEMVKEIKALSQGSRNIQSGIHVTQIADGAMQSISDNIMDMESNAIRAMNGTMSADDRAILQEGTKASMATIDHVSNMAEYNGKKLLNGSNTNMNIYTGTSSEMIGNADMRIKALSLQNFSLTSGDINTSALDEALNKVVSSRADMGATANGLKAANRINQINIENTASAESRLTDTEMGEAISKYKTSETLSSVQNMMLKKKMEQDQGETKLF